jgi:hypothetical protein
MDCDFSNVCTRPCLAKEKQHSVAALQDLAAVPTHNVRLRLGSHTAPALVENSQRTSRRTGKACHPFVTIAAIGERALCQSVLCS